MRVAILLSFAATTASAQKPTLDSTSVAPAAVFVHTPTDAGVDLFENEKVQITEDIVGELLGNPDVAQFADVFAFANSTVVTEPEWRQNVRRSLRCKTSPGDSIWPSSTVWGIFDILLGGALEQIVPVASPCYPNSEYNNYNEERCAKITNEWALATTHTESDSSVMFPLYYGQTCKQGTDPEFLTSCTLGGYSSFSVHVKNVAQIQLAVDFARSLNIRLVIKNTGHDYNGRSTGKYALSLWTHNLKGIQYIKNYKSESYTGPVFKVGAGVQGFEIYEAAEKHGVTAVAGICPSVGIFGGYSTGGGHSPVMQLFGMGADQILELQVVTASGRFVTVSQTSNSDLYWAMLGGGGGTFGIITSAVVKVHEQVPVTTSEFDFGTSETVSVETFWEAVQFFWNEMPKYNAAKTYSYFSIMKAAPGVYTFTMRPFFATRMTVAQFNALTKALFHKLEELKIPYDIETKYYDRFYPAYQATFGELEYYIGSAGSTPGNRILPKENWDSPALSNATFAAVRNAVELALVISVYHQAPADIPIVNSVNPAFRNQAGMLIAANRITDTSPAGLKAGNAQLTNEILGPLRDVTPKGGTYGNEADISEPDWQQAFWGANYRRLLQIKKMWDPTDLFYVHHGVGTEGWVIEDGERGIQTQDGKLCRAP